jgi:hypothetical protein
MARPAARIAELSERYCGSASPVTRRASPTNRIERYGRAGIPPMRISVFTWPYENTSRHREENRGNAQTVVRNRANAGRRLR